MTEIRARYRIVTPAFLSGNNPKAPDEGIRGASLKGALRFWWRVLNWGRFRQGAEFCQHGDDAKTLDATALQALHAEEARIFGAAAEKGTAKGQSLFLLRITQQPKNQPIVQDWPKNNTGSGYLGMGLFQMGKTPQSQALPEDGRFEVALRFNPKRTQTGDVEQVMEALRALGLAGGLGGRARRGFGALALESLGGEDWTFAREADYLAALQTLLGAQEAPPALPPYTAWSQQGRLAVIARGQDARRAHGALGNSYRQFRTPADGGYRAPAKVVFGRPLQEKKNAERRRGSPLFMHIHPTEEGFIGTGLFMPGQFHPEDPSPDWQPVHDFLDRHERVPV